MSHMVIFQTPEGNPGYNQFETVEESVAFVESLRNEQNVLNARIFKLDEVRFEFRPYFRVQLAQLGAGESAPGFVAEPPAAPTQVATPPAAAPAAPPAPASAIEPSAAEGLTGEVTLGSVTLGEPPADSAAPTNLDSPVGAGTTAPNGSAFGGSDEERGRRGLFGR